MVQVAVPALGESVTEATILKWLKKEGEAVERDEPLVELETDKVTVEVNAPSKGVLAKITSAEGATVSVGAILGEISEGGAVGAAPKTAGNQSAPGADKVSPAAHVVAPASSSAKDSDDKQSGPAARKLMDENNVAPFAGTGKDGRATKGDVLDKIANAPSSAQSAPSSAQPAQKATGNRTEERVKMTRLRQVIAKRLKDAQNTAAMLTTFNEIDMSNVIALRNSYKDQFEKRHGVKLGFMGFFVKAAVHALKEFPAVNAEIRGDEVIYKNYYDVSVAVSTPTGLVVPVVRNCEDKSIADIEKAIGDLGLRARDGKLEMAEMQGGTFTITNGGVFGSLMSTPILNPPQSGILGMHKTMDRPIAVNGQVVIRPMMYIALSYDHRIVDGKEAVSFLVRIKDSLENPQRLLLDV